MSNKNIIKSVEIDLGGKTIKLTAEEAQKLQDALNELFGRKIEKEYIPYPVPTYPRLWTWPYKPGIVWSSRDNSTDVRYSSSSNSLCLSPK